MSGVTGAVDHRWSNHDSGNPSPAEILESDFFPLRLASLIEIDDANERAAAGLRILEELEVPVDERDVWLEPLIDA